MAVKGALANIPIVIKESGGRFFLSRQVPWTGKPEKRPPEVIEKNIDFTKAVETCKKESKKRPDVFTPSKYNLCLRKELKKVA